MKEAVILLADKDDVRPLRTRQAACGSANGSASMSLHGVPTVYCMHSSRIPAKRNMGSCQTRLGAKLSYTDVLCCIESHDLGAWSMWS